MLEGGGEGERGGAELVVRRRALPGLDVAVVAGLGGEAKHAGAAAGPIVSEELLAGLTAIRHVGALVPEAGGLPRGEDGPGPGVRGLLPVGGQIVVLGGKEGGFVSFVLVQVQ